MLVLPALCMTLPGTGKLKKKKKKIILAFHSKTTKMDHLCILSDAVL